MFRYFFAAVSLLCMPGLVRAGTVTNGGFETGDLTGWTQDLGGYALVFCNNARFTPNTGSCALSLTNSGFEILSQTFATTPGTAYDFDFWLQNTPGEGGSENFTATWDGNTVLSIPSQTAPMSYTHQVFTSLIATGASTKISFSGNGLTLRRWVFDDVNVTESVTPTPEPVTVLESFAGFAVFGVSMLRSRARRKQQPFLGSK